MDKSSLSFRALKYILLDEYDLKEMNVVVSSLESFVFYQKDSLEPLQLDKTKESLSDLELSSYAAYVDENEKNFISRFRFVEKVFTNANNI